MRHSRIAKTPGTAIFASIRGNIDLSPIIYHKGRWFKWPRSLCYFGRPKISNTDSSKSRSGLSYKDAGVDIAAGNALVGALKGVAAGTDRTGVMGGLGGFGGFFDPKAAGYQDPILVSATDGVGTKLMLAHQTGHHDTVGIDLVAMCVNDLIVQGAEPLFFLDYFATGKLETGTAETVVAGIAKGCKQAGCALIGGETAEMPGMYGDGEYDLAGFAVGAVERDKILTGETIAAGDLILGLPSSGVHSNGFSLVRKVVEKSGLPWDAPAPFETDQGAHTSLGEALLTPTEIYVKACLAAIRAGGVKGFAHITGGGLLENIPRILPQGVTARLEADRWDAPPVFRWLKETGAIADEEMARTFNCGIGMVVIVKEGMRIQVQDALKQAGYPAAFMGRIEGGDASETMIDGLETLWQD